jgi:prepilin-type N-terminal cleavage/methylation domain-containing protein
MFSNRKRPAGFTLPEVLVTVAIVAVLAAAVVPTVVNQMSKGETGAVISDVNALSTGVTQFVTDTRHYPKSIRQLNVDTAVQAADPDLMAGTLGAAGANAWRGPYLSTTQDLLSFYDMAGLGIRVSEDFVAPVAGNGYHIAMTLTKGGGAFTMADIAKIDQTLDGGDGAVKTDCTVPTPGSAAGRLQWTESAACVITAVTYRLVPTGK